LPQNKNPLFQGEATEQHGIRPHRTGGLDSLEVRPWSGFVGVADRPLIKYALDVAAIAQFGSIKHALERGRP
jgi:hypothetical protein